MRIGSLFSGYGGLELGIIAELGGTVAWHAEVNPHASKVLAHRFPDVPNLGDITQLDWREAPAVDVLCGGFPCQDMSSAGKRAGIGKATRSGLWVHFAKAIQHLRPALVIIENVKGIVNARADIRALGRLDGGMDTQRGATAIEAVLADLAELGMDARWVCLPTSRIGGPHKREREFIAAAPAHPDGFGIRRHGTPRSLAGAPSPARKGGTVGISDTAHRSAIGAGWHRLGAYASALQAWEAVTGRPAPCPTKPHKDGRVRQNPAFVEWMMGLPLGWVTDVPGLSRAQQLTILGNGVVPPQAAEALRLLLDESLWNPDTPNQPHSTEHEGA